MLPKQIFQKLKAGGQVFTGWAQKTLQVDTNGGGPRVRCYVDGLNFYYGVAAPYNFKWINLEGLLQELLELKLEQPRIEKIIMFTSDVKGTAAEMQGLYLKALEDNIDCLEMVRGTHITREVSGLLLPDRYEEARVETVEEKGTDVNFACRLVEDAYEDVGKVFDIACVVTNDGDMAEALRVKRRKDQRVILISPRSNRSRSPVSYELKKHVDKRDIISRIHERTVRKYPMPRRNQRY